LTNATSPISPLLLDELDDEDDDESELVEDELDD